VSSADRRAAEPQSSRQRSSGSARREVAEHDAAILERSRRDDDLDSLAAFAARTPLDDIA
jgi:hypothetical protein